MAAGPGVQVLPDTPPVQVVTPVDAQASMPQVVGVPTYSASAVPSPSSPPLSQPCSSMAAGPGVHVLPDTPPVQVVTPVDAQAPMPQVVGVPTKSSSAVPSQSSSTLSQL